MVTVATWAFPPLLKPPVFAALGLRAASRLGFGLRIDPILLGGEAVRLLREIEAGGAPISPRRLPAQLVLRQSA